MISATIPDNEDERLKALYRYEVLDTAAEKVFDDLTELASEICDTPIALISLVDPDRQWFKSKVGLDAEETSRDIAFCAHAIHQKEIFEVTDTHQDTRFKDNPLVQSDPHIRFYAGTPLRTPDGHAIGTLCAISDKPKELNEHQRKALEILGRQVISQLELRLKIKEVELANQRKTDFLSNLSHELRTPLNAIVGFSQLMLKEQQASLSDKYLSFLKHLDFSGKRLLDLVNTVLDLNKIEAGKLELDNRAVSIKPFFESIHGVIRALADEKGVTLTFSISGIQPEFILVDEVRLSQIILNLVANAIKFSPAHQTVTISVVFSQEQFTIAVKDHGEGIAESDIPLLFAKFQQVGNAKHEGSGLGLMITKSLVELMGGSIKLNSTLGKGTLVKVDIPLKLPEDKDVHKLNERSQRQYNLNTKILVVEDNGINQEVAKAIFDSLGLNIDLADSGEDALVTLQNNQYDVIFMDLHLPGIDGFETSKQIIQRLPNQIIIALTADIFAGKNDLLRQSGMIDYLSKPIDLKSLVKMLNQYCPSQH